MEQVNSLRKAAYFFLVIIGIAVVVIILKELDDIFIPFVIAYFLFFVFSPLNRFLQRKKIPLSAAILIDLLIVLIIFGSISSVIIDSFSRFGNELPVYQEKLDNLIISSMESLGISDPELRNFQIMDLIKKIDYKMVAGNIFTSTFSALGSLLLILFFFIFVVTGHNNVYNAIKKSYLNRHKNLSGNESENSAESEKEQEESKEKSVQTTFQEITDQVQNYIVTKFFISLITAIFEGITIWIFGVDFVIVWAVLIFMLNFIPNIGSLIALTLPCVMALIQFGSIPTALFLAAILFVIDTIMGNIVEPKVFGSRLGLNPLVVLFSLLLWGYVWGIIGALLSVPLTAVVKIMISKSDSPNLIFINDLMSSGPNV